MTRKLNFSLTEMLIVISIVLILISFMVPGLKFAMSNAYKSKCANHLRQSTVTILQYVDDNFGYLPFGRINNLSVNGAIGPYLGLDTKEYGSVGGENTTMQCPSDITYAHTPISQMKRLSYVHDPLVLNRHGFIDGINHYPTLGTNYPYKSHRLAKMENPNKKFVFADGYRAVSWKVEFGAWRGLNHSYWDPEFDLMPGKWVAWDAHQSGANVSFLDNHVEWIQGWKNLRSL